MSGTACNYWGMSEYDNHLGIVYEIAKDFGKPTEQLDKLVKILLSQTPGNITESLLSKYSIDRTLSSLFGPVIESETHQMKLIARKFKSIFPFSSIKIGSNAVQPFITESIDRLYDTQDINITTMFTVTSAVS